MKKRYVCLFVLFLFLFVQITNLKQSCVCVRRRRVMALVGFFGLFKPSDSDGDEISPKILRYTVGSRRLWMNEWMIPPTKTTTPLHSTSHKHTHPYTKVRPVVLICGWLFVFFGFGVVKVCHHIGWPGPGGRSTQLVAHSLSVLNSINTGGPNSHFLTSNALLRSMLRWRADWVSNLHAAAATHQVAWGCAHYGWYQSVLL